jgi:hypothetical protein
MSAPPIPCIWLDGEGVFRPTGNYAALAAKHYGDGEVVALVEHHDSSEASRGHYFAILREGWLTLPEDLTGSFPTTDHLRKFLLIQCGFRNEQMIACTSHAEAVRAAAIVKQLDPYSVVTLSSNVARIWTALSQKKAAMGAERFQASKVAVLDALADLLGTDLAALSRARAA